MWATIVAFIPFLQQIINWWNAKNAAQTSQDQAVSDAEKEHLGDGAQSVIDGQSADQQMLDLQKQQAALDAPPAGDSK